jgi:hypothetical protein
MFKINKPMPYSFNLGPAASAWPFPVYDPTNLTIITTGRISSEWPCQISNTPKEDTTMKLKDNPNFDKQDYKDLKEWASTNQVSTIVSAEGNINYNGYVIAWQRAMPHAAEGKMIRVAVSFCSVDDDFKKKIGKYQAFNKIYYNEYIQLPLAQYEDEEIEDMLRTIFDNVE